MATFDVCKIINDCMYNPDFQSKILMWMGAIAAMIAFIAFALFGVE